MIVFFTVIPQTSWMPAQGILGFQLCAMSLCHRKNLPAFVNKFDVVKAICEWVAMSSLHILFSRFSERPRQSVMMLMCDLVEKFCVCVFEKEGCCERFCLAEFPRACCVCGSVVNVKKRDDNSYAVWFLNSALLK